MTGNTVSSAIQCHGLRFGGEHHFESAESHAFLRTMERRVRAGAWFSHAIEPRLTRYCCYAEHAFGLSGGYLCICPSSVCNHHFLAVAPSMWHSYWNDWNKRLLAFCLIGEMPGEFARSIHLFAVMLVSIDCVIITALSNSLSIS